MVDTKYTPILKWKKAEQGAIEDLTKEQKDLIAPLFEIVPSSLTKRALNMGCKTADDKLLQLDCRDIPSNILDIWGDERNFFVDFTLLPAAIREEFAIKFLKYSDELHIQPIPVFNLSDNADYIHNMLAIVSSYSIPGVCARLTFQDILGMGLVNSKLEKIFHQVPPEKVHILVDLKERIDESSYETAIVNTQSLDELKNFGSVIIAGGSFPKDMTRFSIDNGVGQQERFEWSHWQDFRNSGTNVDIHRMPAFADYTIRHPIYDEAAMKFPASATIKYTANQVWEIYKGAQRRPDHYLASASILRTLKYPHFYGANFSAGDAFIDAKGALLSRNKQEKNGDVKLSTGNAEKWLRAGINHHIAVVVHQISSLDDKKASS